MRHWQIPIVSLGGEDRASGGGVGRQVRPGSSNSNHRSGLPFRGAAPATQASHLPGHQPSPLSSFWSLSVLFPSVLSSGEGRVLFLPPSQAQKRMW